MFDKNTILGMKYESLMDKSKRKDYGSFYTPDFIINYILSNTLEKVDVIENPFLKVLDPSCGSGYFLIKSYDILLKKFLECVEILKEKYTHENYIVKGKKISGKQYWIEENISYHILKNCIYGSDVDNEAVEITKLNLMRNAKLKLDLCDNIVCCNSLIKWENQNDNKKLYDFWSRSYEFVIGNPPWVSLKRKYARTVYKDLIDYYVKEYDGSSYLPNLYEYFIKRSLEVMKDFGKVAFVLPRTFAENLQYTFFRKKILDNYNIENLAFEIDFPNVTIDTMIIVLSKSYNINNKVCVNICNKGRYYIYQNRYLNNKNYEFLYEVDNLNNKIKASIENNSALLGDISLTFTGFIGEKTKITKSRIDDSQVEILKGENICSFKVINTNYYEFNKDSVKGGTKDLKKLKYKNKIVVRKTGNSIIAALDINGIIIEQSLYGIINLNKKFSYKYVLGILNSKLIQWYYLNFLVTNEKSIPQLKKYNLDSIPIKYCDKLCQKKVERIVDRLMCNDDDSQIELKDEMDGIIFRIYDLEKQYISMINSSLELSGKSKNKGKRRTISK